MREKHKLTNRMCLDAEVKERNYFLGDGGQLYLAIDKHGNKSFYHGYYSITGKGTKRISFGKFPYMSLGKAREISKEIKKMIDAGIDPVKKRRDEQRAHYEECMRNNLLEDEE